MYWLKSCIRCSGDLAEEDDIHCKDIMCIQCGFRQALVEVLQFRTRLTEKMAIRKGEKLARVS